MGRKRKKIIRITKKLPKVYNCPSCGRVSIRINRTIIKEDNPIIEPGKMNKKLYDIEVRCGDCRVEKTYQNRKDSIDIYNDFVDWFMKEGITVWK